MKIYADEKSTGWYALVEGAGNPWMAAIQHVIQAVDIQHRVTIWLYELDKPEIKYPLFFVNKMMFTNCRWKVSAQTFGWLQRLPLELGHRIVMEIDLFHGLLSPEKYDLIMVSNDYTKGITSPIKMSDFGRYVTKTFEFMIKALTGGENEN